MTSRKRVILKPLSLATTQQSKAQSNFHETSNSQAQNSSSTHSNNEKKRVLLSPESLQPKVPIIQRSRVPVPIINGNSSDTDSEDSSYESKNTEDTKSIKLKENNNNNYLFYFKVIFFLCWLFVQYWMIAVAGFGAVFFVCSALIAIYLNTSNSHKRRNVLSAYSVFNPQCVPIHGSADPKQLERELVFGGL